MTAITEQTRNSTKAARGLNSIFNNLAQVLDDASSNGKKITAIFDSLDISMYDNEGQLLSSYELLGKLNSQWDTLDTNTKNYIASTIAGTNQLNNFLALMNNFDHAVEATETALNSAGSAARENSRYMESLEAKTQQLKATFQDLANNVIDSELIKSILDLANNSLNLLNTEVGQTITQWALLAGTLTGVIAIFGTIGTKLVGSIATIGKLVTGASSLASIFGAATTAGTGLTATLGSLFSVAFPIAGILAAIGVGGYAIYKAYQESNPTLEEATEELNSLNSQLEDNKNRLDEINNLQWNEKTDEILAEKDALELQNEQLKQNIDLLEKRQKKAAIEGANKTQEVYRETRYRTFGQDVTWGSLEEGLEYIDKIYGKDSTWGKFLIEQLETFNVTVEASGDALNNSLVNVLKDAIEDLNEFGSVTDKNNNILQNNLSVIQEQVENYTTLKDLGYELSDSQQSLVDAFNEYNTVSENAVSHTEWLNDNLVANATSIQSLKNAYPELSSAISESNGVIGINVEQLFSQENQSVETRKELARLVAELTVFNQTGLDGSQIISSLLQIATAAGVAADSMIYAQQAAAGDSRASAYMLKKYGSVQNWFESLLGQISSTPEKVVNATKTGVSSATKQATDEALEVFKSYYKDLQHLRDMDEIDEEEYLNRLRILVDNYTSDATANMEAYGTDTEKIARNMYQYEEELVDGWKQLQDERVEAAKEAQQQIIDALEEEQSIYEKFFSYMTDRIQEEIDDLQDEYDKVSDYWDEQIDALKAQNDELEKQIDLEEKLEALARAKQSKVLLYKDGKFQYVQNVEEINEAQVALEEYDRVQALEQEVNRLEELKNQALDSIQDQIDGWEEYKEQWSSVVDHYEEEQDRLLIEQELGIELEGENWQLRLENLGEYVSQYEALMARVAAAQQQLDALESGDLSEFSGGGGLSGSNVTIGGTYSSSTDYLSAALKAAAAGNIDEAQELWNRRGYKVSAEGNDRGTSQSEAWNMIMNAYKTGSISSSGSSGSSNKGSSSSSSNRDDLNNAIKDAVDKAQSSGDKVYIGGSGLYIDPSKLKTNAKGTTNFSGGLSLVGEEGPELRVLNRGDGIVSNGLTKNLIAMAQQYGSKDFTSNQESITSNEYQYSFDKLVLPNVTDFNSFLKEIKRFRRFAFQQ